MISSLANRTAVRLKQRNPDNPNSVEKLQFALHLVYNIVFTLMIALGLSAILGHFWETTVILAASFLLRRYSGGYHMANSWSCIALTTIISNLIPYIKLEIMGVILLTSVSGLLACIFAPSRIEHDTNIPKERYKYLKITSVLIICTNFIFLSSLLAVTYAFQSFSLIRFNRREVEQGDRE